MLSVSETAMQQLHNSLKSAANSNSEDKCFRIVPKDETNLALSLSRPAPTDTTFEFDGNTVLAVPQELKEFCDDKSLDVNDKGQLELM